jgi:hypothetical protein
MTSPPPNRPLFAPTNVSNGEQNRGGLLGRPSLSPGKTVENRTRKEAAAEAKLANQQSPLKTKSRTRELENQTEYLPTNKRIEPNS